MRAVLRIEIILISLMYIALALPFLTSCNSNNKPNGSLRSEETEETTETFETAEISETEIDIEISNSTNPSLAATTSVPATEPAIKTESTIITVVTTVPVVPVPELRETTILVTLEPATVSMRELPVITTIAPAPITTVTEPQTEPQPPATEPPATLPAPVQTDPPDISNTVSSQDINNYFNNSVFVGDSITEGLHRYVLARRKIEPTLGDAKFLCTTIGIRLADCVGDMGGETLYFSYKGAEKPFEQCISEMDVNKVFIMLGTNDLEEGFSITDTIDRYNRTIDKIYETIRGVEVIILFNTPRNDSSWKPWYCFNKDFGNPLIDEFVEEIKKMCNDRSFRYVDLNRALKGSNNAMREEYCLDNFVHINNAGSKVVVDTLNEFAKNVIAWSRREQ